MQLPLVSILLATLLALVAPLPLRYASEGSLLQGALVALHIPGAATRVLLHPLCISPLLHYAALLLVHWAVSYPLRYFLLGFGVHVSNFSGTSVTGLVMKARRPGGAEIVVRADEIGFDIRTMRRLRLWLRTRWAALRRRNLRPDAAPQEPIPPPPPPPPPPRPSSSARSSMDSCLPDEQRGVAVDESKGSANLSKRLQIYARGVRIQVLAASVPGDDDDGDDTLWPSEDEPESPRATPEDSSETHVLDRRAQELAARLARKISTILRTYTYFASLFARWIDISVSDVSLTAVHSSDMARSGHGITLHVASATLWAESARESRGAGWAQTDILNSLRWILDWLLRNLKLRRHDAHGGADAAARLHRLSRAQKRDRSQKYLSTLALEASGIRLFAGIEGAQQHMNSRWELVKMLVMQDMLASKSAGDSDKPHHRGPAVHCQRCTIRNDVITSFWGLPKKVVQRIEVGQTHVRAGAIESLLDEISIMRLAPGHRSSSFSTRSLRALNEQLAGMLRHGHGSPTPGPPPAATSQDHADAAAEAREQVNRMLFLLHEVLSKLRMEHVGLALRVAELVFDLPLPPDKQALVVRAPAMLRWRQRNAEVECGYMWAAIGGRTPPVPGRPSHADDDDRPSLDEEMLRCAWHDDADDVFARGFEDQTQRRSKDSTAFFKASMGTVQATALLTPSMTPDPRAEELHSDAPGFRLRVCTIYAEMSAFLSEDLSHRPSPQPMIDLDVGRPELILDLYTQLAIDSARKWAVRTSHRLRTAQRILDNGPPGTAAEPTESSANHYLYALANMVFSDVKARVTVERALYAVQPNVPLDATKKGRSERIALRMHHFELHLLWNLLGSQRGGGGGGGGCQDALLPSLRFRMTSSPITAQWEGRQPPPQPQPQQKRPPKPTMLQIKRGLRASGTVDLHIGTSVPHSTVPRANVSINVEAGDISCMLREYDFRAWLSMQPLWLVTRLVHLGRADSADLDKPAVSFDLPPIEERRKRLVATVHVLFDHVRVTVLACDNEEDVRSGIEHGTQISLTRGFFDIRANGGSLESPHPFSFREDVARITLNIECQQATMYLLSAVPHHSARPETLRNGEGLPAGFAPEDLEGWLPDMVQQHIVLVRPQFNFSRRKLEPGRSRLIFDLTTTSFSGTNSVSSVYRWAVFMHHIKYWRRRRRLARDMAIQRSAPPPPDDVVVSINSDLLDLRGDLVSPVFFDVARGGFELEQSRSPGASAQAPELKLKMPQVRFSIEKTNEGTEGDMAIALSGPICTLYGSSTPKGQRTRMGMRPLISLSDCDMAMRFPRKDKRAELGAADGVRKNSTYNKIDIAFSQGALALGHQYNMAETIDGYMLMQKACKRIARKSTSTCFPPAIPSEQQANCQPSKEQILAVLGNQHTFSPPPLRLATGVKPPPPPSLREPDDVPTIDFHGPEFTIMVHDDPFETALARIYQVGLVEQRERLGRLEAFETKARELRRTRAQELALQREAATASGRSSSRGRPAPVRRKHTRTGLHHRRTQKGAKRSSDNVRSILRGLTSASMQDVTSTASATPSVSSRARTSSMVADSPSHSATSLASEGGPVVESPTGAPSISDADDHSYEDVNLGKRSVDAEIDAAYLRLMQVEAGEWIRAIRERMVPPPLADTEGDHFKKRSMDFSEIFGFRQKGEPVDERLPYTYCPSSWTHPSVPLGRLVMSPMWLAIDTPLALLEFAQVESYLRHLDPATPHKLEWSTLVPMRMRLKCGDARMQLRDFPFPFFCVPDPYRQEASAASKSVASYDEFSGGVEISGSLVLAERVAHERSLRSVYIPIAPRASSSPINLPDVGWYLAKSLQFPRIFMALSVVMYSAPVEEASTRGVSQQLPILSVWGASYQPVISALMQRLESATSKSADVSPSLPWWDKLRSRFHFKSRMAVIDSRNCMSSRNAEECEKGQMFFLALDGRDPYQVTQKPGSSYLFTMRGGVRMCLNEGFPGSELWDKASGRGIYSVPTEEETPPSATLSEFMQLRCEEFLMGPPIIIDRQAQLLRFMEDGQNNQDDACTGHADLLRSISSERSARYTFITQGVDRLYYKVLLHLSGGVRMGIGLSSYIPPDAAGLRHNHWEVHPIAPESASAMASLGITDAYAGYRSNRIHTSISLLCPFTDSVEQAEPRPFTELYMDQDKRGTRPPRLRQPEARVMAKKPTHWNAYDVDALVSPMHTLFHKRQNAPTTYDQFFVSFVPTSGNKPNAAATSDESSSQQQQPPPMSSPPKSPQLGQQRANTALQCRISATASVVEGVQQYLPMFVARMMLPVRKGSLYPFTETSDNKIAKCLRSMRLVLDLKNVELAYSQRDLEIKEFETREFDMFGLGDMSMSPTPSDASGVSQPVSSSTGAKAEGIMRELKGRVESFSFNLLLEQAQVKIQVGEKRSAASNMSPDPAGLASGEVSVSKPPRAKRRSDKQLRESTVSVGATQTTALRWGVGDASLEIDYLDVRLVQSSFTLPLFMDLSRTGLLDKCVLVNGLRFLRDSQEGLDDSERSWISCASIRDIKELDIGQAIFNSPSVVCVLWSPRLVYFTQRAEFGALFNSQPGQFLDPYSSVLGFPQAMTDTPSSPMRAGDGGGSLDLHRPPFEGQSGLAQDGSLHLQRSLSAQRARAVSDLQDVLAGRPTRPHVDGVLEGDVRYGSERPHVSHRRNTSMPWAESNPTAADSDMPASLTRQSTDRPSTESAKTPVSAMSYKSSFHLLELARTRHRRLTASSSRPQMSRQTAMLSPQSPTAALQKVGSERDLVELQRQISLPIEQTLSNTQSTPMMPTGPDPKVIMRDSRSTQAMLLEKRKEMLGTAIQHEQAALVFLSREFERAPSKHNEHFRREMVRRAEHIYELGARRKLINRCLRVLGFSSEQEHSLEMDGDMNDDSMSQQEVDFDRDTQEVEKILASLYRHRCLIYSGYLIWTTQVRDKLMRFLYIQDCLTAIEYYMSESATNVVRKAAKGQSVKRAENDVAGEATPKVPPSEGGSRQPAYDQASTSQQPAEDSSSAGMRRRSASQHSAKSTSSHRTLHIPRILRKLQSQEKVSSGSSSAKAKGKSKANEATGSKHKPKPKDSTGRRKRKPKQQKEDRKLNSKFDKAIDRVWDDFDRYWPYYSIMVEFLNSQVSLRIDEDSATSAVAVAERVQLHRILLCNGSEADANGATPDSISEAPPSDESVVKARSLVEFENVQVFTAHRSDFENQAAYFVDCTYGSKLDAEDPSRPTTLWPAWIPIELLLGQRKDQVRGIFDEFDQEEDPVADATSDSPLPATAPADTSSQSKDSERKYGKAWWVEDLSKYKRLMNRNSGMVVYDKSNPLRIQSDTVSGTSNRPRSSTVKGTRAEASAAMPGGTSAGEAARNDGLPVESEGTSDDAGIEEDLSDGSELDDDDDPIDSTETSSSEHGLSHRANHFSVFLPELNLACTAEQYIAVYETVTDLLVFIDPEKAAYMDHLNTIQLGMDMSDLRGLHAIIRATQTALRERLPIIHDWYSIQRSRAVLFASGEAGRLCDSARHRAQAASLLTLDRHRRALELQLRTATDLFGAAQKQMRRQQLHSHSQAQDPSRPRRLTTVSTASERGAESQTSTTPDPLRPASQGRPVSSSGSQTSSSTGMRSVVERHQNTITRTIHVFVSKATWHMLENDEQPLCDVTLRWATLKAVTTSDQATHLLSEVHLLYIVNRLPDPMFTDLVGPYIRPKHPKPDFCVEKMIRVQWSELAPVGGISIVERFEVDLFPLRLQLSHDIAQKLINYLYPPQDTGGLAGVGTGQDSASLLSPRNKPQQRRRPTMSSIASDDEADASSSAAPLSPTPSSMVNLNGDVPDNDTASKMSTTSASRAGSWRRGTSAYLSPNATSAGRSLLSYKMRRNVDSQHKLRANSEDLPKTAASPVPSAVRQLTPQQDQGLPRVASGLLATISGRSSTPLSMLSSETNAVMSVPQSGDNRSQVDEMKKRASSNKTFLNIKIGSSTLCISYQGRKANNITDLRDFEFHAPLLELRNQVESYYELLMQVKKEYMSVAVQHTGALVKEKFRQLHNRKAWSKSSFGPDWDARRLLLDMDNRIEEDMTATVRAGWFAGNARNSPYPQRSAAAAPGGSGQSSRLTSVDPYGSPTVDAGDNPPLKIKAPLSKYMILDPRKLMGKRLPNLLPLRGGQLQDAFGAAGRSEPPSSPPYPCEENGGRAMSCAPVRPTEGDSGGGDAGGTVSGAPPGPPVAQFPSGSQKQPLLAPVRPPLHRRFTASAADHQSRRPGDSNQEDE
ncbi:Protein SABRE [Coemansia sp. RSA 552]|nr:Protein SABRE [Coemansia sp. RSA 552]